jgi:hypothetical protein
MKKLVIFLFFFQFLFASEPSIHEKILILGVCKNTVKGFQNVKESVEALAPHFLDYQIIIYENNSTDKTKELYKNWAQENAKLIFLSEDLNPSQLASIAPETKGKRIGHIARAREIVLQKALSKEYDDFEYVLMADLDEFFPWHVEGILKTILEPEQEWDAVFANGSYDVFALRSPLFSVGVEHIGYDSWFSGLWMDVGRVLARELQKGKWLKVDSAFGGLALYKRQSLIGCHYHSQINQKFFDWMLDRPVDFSYLPYNKQQLLKKNWDLNLKFLEEMQSNNFLVNLNALKTCPTVYLFPCEHVWLHYDMIEHGYDRLFINPNLKMKSKIYKNF